MEIILWAHKHVWYLCCLTGGVVCAKNCHHKMQFHRGISLNQMNMVKVFGGMLEELGGQLINMKLHWYDVTITSNLPRS